MKCCICEDKFHSQRRRTKNDILGNSTKQETPLTAKATAVSGGTTDPFPDQTAIDGLPDQPAVNTALIAAQELLIEPLLREIRHGADPATILTRLGGLYPYMDTAGLEELLTRAFFVADLIGADAVAKEEK